MAAVTTVIELDLNNCRGESYGNGCHRGVRSRIIELNPLATYVISSLLNNWQLYNYFFSSTSDARYVPSKTHVIHDMDKRYVPSKRCVV